MTLPKQIQEQTEAVKKLYENMYKSEESPPVEIQQQPEPEPKNDTIVKQMQEFQSWATNEISRLSEELRNRDAYINMLQQQARPQEPATSVQPEYIQPKYLTDEDTKEYGEVIDVMRRAAREEAEGQFTPIIQELRAQLAELKGIAPKVENIAEDQARSREMRFFDDLTTLVPDWRAINADPGFKGWLKTVDPYTGQQYNDLLRAAQQKMDVRRVATFLNDWLYINTSDNQTQDAPVNVQPPTQPNSLEYQVAPGKGRTSAPQSNDKKIWTRSEINSFYSDITSGKYRTRQQERAALEADLFLAGKEGRVRD